jgi:DNA-binding GntR family transcriptional regulator
MEPRSTAGGPYTTTQHALGALRAAIVAGELRPGGRIGQDEFAQLLGISVAPVREALQILQQEGQVSYFPRRGYFVTELEMADLEEIYALRALLEGRAARQALRELDALGLEVIESAARAFESAVASGDVIAELAANRRFHLAILDSPRHPHTMRVIRKLWDSTEAYRALYYNLEEERHSAVEAHERIISALRERDAKRLVAELDAHRERALVVLRRVLSLDD